MNLAACIIEPRPEHLKIALENHLEFLPMGTKIYIFTDISNSLFRYHQLNIDKFKNQFFSLKNLSHRQHGELMSSAKFWNTFAEEHILIFQSDSALLRTGIEEFYIYDFIGAPIKRFPDYCMNGGLSLRKKSAMLKVIENFRFDYSKENEDVFFCKGLHKLGGKLPTKEVAMKFSVETMFAENSLGYHCIDKYLTPEQCEQIRNQYKDSFEGMENIYFGKEK